MNIHNGLNQGFLTSGKFPPRGKFQDLRAEILKLQIDDIYYTRFKDLAVVFHCHHMHGADKCF